LSPPCSLEAHFDTVIGGYALFPPAEYGARVGKMGINAMVDKGGFLD
jgi:hypothetical protein